MTSKNSSHKANGIPLFSKCVLLLDRYRVSSDLSDQPRHGPCPLMGSHPSTLRLRACLEWGSWSWAGGRRKDMHPGEGVYHHKSSPIWDTTKLQSDSGQEVRFCVWGSKMRQGFRDPGRRWRGPDAELDPVQGSLSKGGEVEGTAITASRNGTGSREVGIQAPA